MSQVILNVKKILHLIMFQPVMNCEVGHLMLCMTHWDIPQGLLEKQQNF